MQAQGKNNGATRRVASVKPLQVRGRFFTAIALHLTGRADQAFFDALDEKLLQTPLFFENAPLVLDLEESQGLDNARDLGDLAQALRDRRLSVFGVQNGNAGQAEAAITAGLVVLPPGGGRNVPLERVSRDHSPRDPKQALAAAAAEPLPTTRLITQPVRSGQTIFADRGDLIIIGPVSSGAEIIAAGNIHVYGRLRGRALAGVNGDTTARIFCNALDAELLAIAGLYTTSEALAADTPRQFVQVFLDEEKLRVESLK